MNGSTLLGFDYGERRIGVALGNTLTRSARPLAVIRNTDTATRFASVARLLAEWQPDALVVGVPLHPDGAEHALTKLCRRFGNQLNGRFGLPVHWVDERYSSAAAAATLAEMAADGIDGEIDAEAACVILQQYLDESGRDGGDPAVGAASQHSCS